MKNLSDDIYIQPLKRTVFGEVVESNIYGPRFNANDYDVKGNVKTIRGTDLGYAGELKYNQIPTAKIDQKTVDTHKLKDGDLVVITTADCGMTAVFREQEFPFIASAYAVRVRLNEKGNSDYFKYYFQTHSARKEISKYVRKATVANLPGSDLLRLKINLPCLAEQKNSADFLSAIDKKISLLKEKYALIEQYKKGVMQKLFSQDIRFKRENGHDFPDWQEECFSNILLLQLNSLKMKDDNEYELITVRRRNRGVDSRGIFKGKEVLVKNQFELKTNQFVISKRQIVHGACGLVPEKLAGSIVSNEYNVFDPVPEKLDINYFNIIAKTLPMRRAFFINSDGVHIEKLLFKTQSWLKTKLDFPCVEEQKKIVSFIETLDRKLELVSQQIEQTKTFKKGLLQQVFV